MSDLISILKIGKKEHISKLFKNGQIHLRPSSYFRKIESEKTPSFLRSDRFEGASQIYNKGKLETFIDGKRLGVAFDPEFILRSKRDAGYIYSLVAIFEDQIECGLKMHLPVSEKIREFGDTALLIYNPNKFVHLFSDYCNQNQISFDFKPVTYVELNKENYSYSIFKKPIQYKYQNEIRLFINREEAEEYINIDIGNLKDISILFKTEDLEKVQIEFNRSSSIKDYSFNK